MEEMELDFRTAKSWYVGVLSAACGHTLSGDIEERAAVVFQ
jgi:hypothetical protein